VSVYELRTADRAGRRAAEDRPPADALLKADEVAALLRVTRAWIYAETRAGRIPHVRHGRYLRYRRSAVDAWVDELERASIMRRRGGGDVASG
jgi:excisionase family DNA binding protein